MGGGHKAEVSSSRWEVGGGGVEREQVPGEARGVEGRDRGMRSSAHVHVCVCACVCACACVCVWVREWGGGGPVE